MGNLTSTLQSREIWRRLRAQFLRIVAIAAAIGLPFMSTASAAEPKRVLIVNSFGTTAPPFSFQSTVFKSELVAKMGEPVDLDEVSLDMARYDADMQQAIVDYLEKRQSKWRTDLVVAIGAPATSFVANHRDQLFGETPILYAAADRRLLPPGALERNAAYVGQLLDIPGVFEDMLQVAPATKNIEIVVGATPLERLWQEAFKKATQPLAGRIKFTYYSDLSFDQMLKRVATLPPNSYILFLLLLRDAQGVTVNADEAMQRLHQVARAPINSLFSHQLGTGIVGGRLLQSDRLGKVAADVAVRILHGEPASSFPPTVIERLSPHYDWRELQRWKIDEKLLPPGSTVLYRAPSLWEEHRALIIGGISICVVEGLLIAGLVVNLIRRRRAERSLTESEERIALAAEAAHLGVWEFDPLSKQLWVSDKARELFHFAPGEPITYADFQQRVHPDDRSARDAATEQAIATQGSYKAEYRMILPDGTVRWISGKGHCVPNENGKSCRLLGVSMDVTERKLAEEEAGRHREELSRLSRIALLGEMTASIAHELNQPLTAIINNASAGQCSIDQGDIKLDTLREILVDIAADGHRAHDVIANIRNTIKKGATVRESVDLNFIVTNVAHMFQPDMAAHSCELETSLAKDLPTVEANPVQIHEVLINLVSNALDAMRDAPPARRKVQIATKRNGDGLIEVAVLDYGAGIPDEVRGRLFDQFFTTKEKGLGMGLAIVRSIIEAHGGTIEAENLKEGGARFNFILPISQETAK
jgi:PAS domain S-box-containing protein